MTSEFPDLVMTTSLLQLLDPAPVTTTSITIDKDMIAIILMVAWLPERQDLYLLLRCQKGGDNEGGHVSISSPLIPSKELVLLKQLRMKEFQNLTTAGMTPIIPAICWRWHRPWRSEQWLYVYKKHLTSPPACLLLIRLSNIKVSLK